VSGLQAGLAAGSLADRAVAITFDDGYASTVRAEPILREFGYPGTVFVVADYVGSGEPFSWPGVDQWRHGPFAGEVMPLTWSQIGDLVEAGWEIASHTRTHPYLPALETRELEDELAGSRETIIRHVGRCAAIAYPYGGLDDRVVAAVRRSGYRSACAVSRGAHAGDPYRMPRVGLYGKDTGLRLHAKLAPFLHAIGTRWHERRAHERPEGVATSTRS
jgi:peptidoglycan/xylan/chitin deacetylase (PgdA/CDA1 family)